MDSRQEQLLLSIIEEYVQSKEPVGSKLLSEKYELHVSPATIRNDMAALEDEGYIAQPHISAGRVPTERAYRFWIEHTTLNDLEKKEQQIYAREWRGRAGEDEIKAIARALSDRADNTVVVAFSTHDFYYTGLSALFSQPEFSVQASTVSMARMIDHLDRILEGLVAKIHERTVLLGKDNPFSSDCGFVGTPLKRKHGTGCIGILGPMRMDYPRHMSRMRFLDELINT